MKYLIPITNEAFTLRQIRWANLIESKGGEAIIFSSVGSHVERIVREKNLKSPKTIIEPPPSLKWMREPKRGGKKKKKSFSRHLLSALRSYLTLSKDLKIYEDRLSYLRSLMVTNHISAIILPEASPAYDTPFYASASKTLNIPLITTPFSRDNPESYAAIYKSDTNLTKKTLLRILVNILFPKWSINYEKKNILRIDPRTVLIHELLKIASPNPWLTIGPLEDAVAVQSEIDFDFYFEHGVDKKKLFVIGSPEQDTLASFNLNKESFKRDLCAELNLDISKKILVTPIVQTHWVTGRSEAEYQDYKELLKAWMKPLQEQGSWNVVISLHPSQKIDDFLYLESEGIRISRRDICELIAGADLLVACLSSVIPLAISSGCPVVNYDVYRYSLENNFLKFQEALGSITVTNYADYIKTIEKLTSDNDFYTHLRFQQHTIADKWGNLDGKSYQRLNNLVLKLKQDQNE